MLAKLDVMKQTVIIYFGKGQEYWKEIQKAFEYIFLEETYL